MYEMYYVYNADLDFTQSFYSNITVANPSHAGM